VQIQCVFLKQNNIFLFYLLLKVIRVLGLTAKNLKTFATTFRRFETSPQNKTERIIIKKKSVGRDEGRYKKLSLG